VQSLNYGGSCCFVHYAGDPNKKLKISQFLREVAKEDQTAKMDGILPAVRSLMKFLKSR
jgi:hypothetical protein